MDQQAASSSRPCDEYKASKHQTKSATRRSSSSGGGSDSSAWAYGRALSSEGPSPVQEWAKPPCCRQCRCWAGLCRQAHGQIRCFARAQAAAGRDAEAEQAPCPCPACLVGSHQHQHQHQHQQRCCRDRLGEGSRPPEVGCALALAPLRREGSAPDHNNADGQNPSESSTQR
eukprot:COSAG06_NODE_3249_length_5601_cov_271.643466_7_plen_172_part_00